MFERVLQAVDQVMGSVLEVGICSSEVGMIQIVGRERVNSKMRREERERV